MFNVPLTACAAFYLRPPEEGLGGCENSSELRSLCHLERRSLSTPESGCTPGAALPRAMTLSRSPNHNSQEIFRDDWPTRRSAPRLKRQSASRGSAMRYQCGGDGNRQIRPKTEILGWWTFTSKPRSWSWEGPAEAPARVVGVARACLSQTPPSAEGGPCAKASLQAPLGFAMLQCTGSGAGGHWKCVIVC